ncbi:helix-turn-helix domain-containing protein [Kitasatospora sp. NBC_00240]|uniref:helix-turn-helix domain-containing protein n=1 Tax=Kitasatospora sp. NBC_00240 TaxID=2903567 RepID=UPI00339354D5
MYPAPGRRQAQARTFGCARVVYNDALAARCRRPWQSPGVRPVESRLMATGNPGGWSSGLRCS